MDKTPLDYALKYAERGWYVFPLMPNTKIPFKNFAWKEQSSNDKNQVLKWSKQYPNCNWAIDLGKSHLSVLDVDNKKGHKGSESLALLELEYGKIPENLVVQSATPVIQEDGSIKYGEHCYLIEPLPNFPQGLGDGLEIKGAGGYVLIPGSTINGVSYKIVKFSKDEWKPAPKTLIDFIRQPKTENPDREIPVAELDTERNIENAIEYLVKEAPISIENKFGNNTAYQVLANLRDKGVSQHKAVDLAARYWNDRCEPPWSYKELENLADNVYKYGKNQPGAKSVEADLVPFDETAKPLQSPSKLKLIPDIQLLNSLQPPNYIVENYFETDTITVLFGDSGSYKSFMAIDIGISVAYNKPWAGKPVKQSPVVYIAGEGKNGIARRIAAWRKNKQIDSKHEGPFYIVSSPVWFDRPDNIRELITAIEDELKGEKPGVVIIDTLAACFGDGDENSTKDMTRFIRYVNKGIRERYNCLCLIIHHTGQQNKTRMRGAYALEAGVDAVYQIERDKNELYTCLKSPAKMKDGSPMSDTWFRADKVVLGVDDNLKEISSLVLCKEEDYKPENRGSRKMGENQQIILDYLKKHEKGRSFEEIKEEFIKRKAEKDKQWSYKRQIFFDTLNKLIDQNFIKEVENRYFLDDLT